VLDNDDCADRSGRRGAGANARSSSSLNLTTTAAIDEIAKRHGVAVHRSASVKANVVEMMLATSRL
jgi:hypothetical protein